MKSKILLLLLAPLFAFASDAPERHNITTTTGEKYENSKVMSNTPVELIIINKEGVFTLKKAELSDEDKIKFGYDKVAFDTESKKREKAEEEFTRKRIETEKIKKEQEAKYATSKFREFLVSEIQTDGILMANFEVTADVPAAFVMPRTGAMSSGGMAGPPPPNMSKAYSAISYKKKGTRRFFITNMPIDGLIDGAEVKGYFSEAGTHTYSDSRGIIRTVPKLEYIGPGLSK
jgi:phosphoribosylformimino-5-aminoimidazole carboxamide ribonucleotide (ProFAR) isomerase